MPRGRKQGSWKDLYDIKEIKNEVGKKSGYIIQEKISGRVVSRGLIPNKRGAVQVARLFLSAQKDAIKSAMEKQKPATEKPKRPRGRPRKVKME